MDEKRTGRLFLAAEDGSWPTLMHLLAKIDGCDCNVRVEDRDDDMLVTHEEDCAWVKARER